jgi:hypothetical protein
MQSYVTSLELGSAPSVRALDLAVNGRPQLIP